MTLKSILIDSNKTRAMKINDGKVQVDIVAIPVDEENDVELSVKVGLYINGQLFDNLESDMDGYIKKTLVIPNGSDQYITLKLEDLTQGIQSKIKNVLILGSQEGQEKKEDMERLKDEIINLKKQINNLGDTKRKEIESESELEKNEVLQLVSRNGMKLGEDRCKKYNDDDEIVIAAVKQNGLALEFASENLKSDQNICLEAVKQNGLALKFVYDNLKKNDLAICLAAVNQDVQSTKFIPKNIVNNEKILEVIFPYGVNHVSDFQSNINTCFWLVDGDLRWMVSTYDVDKFIETKYKFVKENKDFVLSLMKKHNDKISDIFNSMGRNLRNDKTIMTFLLIKNMSYLKEIGQELVKDQEFVLKIIEEIGIDKVKSYLTEEMRKLPGVKKITDEYEKKQLKEKKDRALEVAKTKGTLEKEFNDDKEIVLEALRKNINSFRSIGEKLQKDAAFVYDCLKEFGYTKIYPLLSEESKSISKIKKIIEEKDKLLKELNDLRELVKKMPEIESRFNKLKEINKKILDAIENCKLAKEKVVSFLSIQSEIKNKERLKDRTKKSEDKYLYSEDIKKLVNERQAIYKFLDDLVKALKVLDDKSFNNHKNKIVDVSLIEDPNNHRHNYWNGCMFLIGREQESNYKCISEYIIRLTNGLENYKKEYDGLNITLDYIKKQKSKIMAIEKDIDKI